MELEFFEPRPPKVAAIRLDFLNDPDGDVAEKLRAMPGVNRIAIHYGEAGRTVTLNPGGNELMIVNGWSEWLVCTPTDTRTELELMGDREFQRRYQRIAQHVTVGTMNILADESVR